MHDGDKTPGRIVPMCWMSDMYDPISHQFYVNYFCKAKKLRVSMPKRNAAPDCPGLCDKKGDI
jgi:hypothetical protein